MLNDYACSIMHGLDRFGIPDSCIQNEATGDWGYAIALAIRRKGEHSQEIGPLQDVGDDLCSRRNVQFNFSFDRVRIPIDRMHDIAKANSKLYMRHNTTTETLNTACNVS